MSTRHGTSWSAVLKATSTGEDHPCPQSAASTGPTSGTTCAVADTDTGELLVEERFAHDEAGIRALVGALREWRIARAAIERPEGVLVGRLLRG
jgi:hypothetical protein